MVQSADEIFKLSSNLVTAKGTATTVNRTGQLKGWCRNRIVKAQDSGPILAG